MLTRTYAFNASIYGEDLEAIEGYLKKYNAFEASEQYILKFK
jgi:hypothetical protein